MKSIVLLALALATLTPAAAQSVNSMAQLNAQRVAEAVPTEAQIKQAKAIEKEARKAAKTEAKNMKAAGWKPAPAADELIVQLTERNIRQRTRSGSAPAYFIATTTARGGSYGIARKQAMARCRAEIAQNLRTEIAGLIETAEQNIELSAGQHETLAKYCDTGMQHYEQNLGRTENVVEAVRESEGSTEVLISLTISSTQLLTAFIEGLAQQDADAAQKIKSALQ